VIDMRGGSGWSSVKPILKALQDWCAGGNGNHVYAVYVVKPDNFWHKQRTSMASHKYKFEVITLYILILLVQDNVMFLMDFF